MRISKSKFMAGHQCPRRLWQQIHHPERADDYGAGTEFTFFQGHEVGELARQWRGKGVLVDFENYDVRKALRQTREALEKGARRIYEAAFLHNGFLALADVIEKKRDGTWRLFEVKATTKAKDVHVPDLAFQAWLMCKNGLDVSETGVIHLNNQAVWPDEPILTLTKNTSDVLPLVKAVAKEARALARMVASTEEPAIDPGPQCNNPYACNFQGHCWRDIPADHVGVLPRLSVSRAAQLEERGWLRVADITDTSMLSETQVRWVEAMQAGKPRVEANAIRDWIGSLGRTVYSLDFETIAYAIPRWRGVRPYQQIPFQFSCHRQGPGGGLTHTGYLHRSKADPRRDLAKALVEALPGDEPIVTWNVSFERRVVGELADLFPRQRKALKGIQARLVDLMPIFQKWYLHPKCAGSASIKVVGEAVLGAEAGYGDLPVAAGDEAYVAWHQLVFDGGESPLADALEAYCAQDTMLPIKLIAFLRRVI
ncbi:MAG: DUF2779 domain-containing protein [Alcanivoracaceae bacterium]|nr:DUF2779 domain-containing protein [Alcanivoracaceae bacterium]